jgi:hypothetical protein
MPFAGTGFGGVVVHSGTADKDAALEAALLAVPSEEWFERWFEVEPALPETGAGSASALGNEVDRLALLQTDSAGAAITTVDTIAVVDELWTAGLTREDPNWAEVDGPERVAGLFWKDAHGLEDEASCGRNTLPVLSDLAWSLLGAYGLAVTSLASSRRKR